MPSYLLDWYLWRDLLPLPIAAALIAALLILHPAIKKGYKQQAFVVILAMSLLGIVIGQLTGQSRDPVVGAVLPAVLGLIGGVAVYLFATKEIITQVLIGLSVIAFSFNLLVGSFWGAKLRTDYDNYYKLLSVRVEQESTEQKLRLIKLFNQNQLKKLRLAFENKK